MFKIQIKLKYKGEYVNGKQNNIMPYITKVASGKLSHINVFDDDYNTFDGTCIRDYIHVVYFVCLLYI